MARHMHCWDQPLQATLLGPSWWPGTRGRTRTGTPCGGGILNPLRLPFRHSGPVGVSAPEVEGTALVKAPLPAPGGCRVKESGPAAKLRKTKAPVGHARRVGCRLSEERRCLPACKKRGQGAGGHRVARTAGQSNPAQPIAGKRLDGAGASVHQGDPPCSLKRGDCLKPGGQPLPPTISRGPRARPRKRHRGTVPPPT